ncbi:HNH endonuclease signature motif containing protein [Neorhizobium sp. T6_25]|uniref:HNH endonuclease n=1 Tax=Neorhizobium sp. T6_25 TaxID=2093833 RepID=UPI000CF8A6F0|nr:HNH endonuclease signature motif containing protein [Neorhizobium sp. T6_25]
MSWGFERGTAYNRRQDIHARFGGQRQSGIITPASHNVIFIISGQRGLEYGYDDRQHPDGLIDYFGEGQRGDMTMTGGNRAIADHLADGKTLLFFEKEYPARHIVFKDEMICQGWHTKDALDRDGNMRKAIVFELRPLDSVVHVADDKIAPVLDDLATLRARAFSAAKPTVSAKTGTRTIYERSADVRDYVLARAKAVCEGCGSGAPFKRPNGTDYLEPHHIRRVSDGGPDDPRFVIALCPNCHRRVHFGGDGTTYNDSLHTKMKSIESN